MSAPIRFFDFPIDGVEAMSASTVHSFPRHTHDQYGIGVVDAGGHASWSGQGEVEAGPGSLICVNPGEVHDGRAVGRRPRTWRMLYVEPALMDATCSDILEGAPVAFTFASPVFPDERVRGHFDAAFALTGQRDAWGGSMATETALLALVSCLFAHSATRTGVRAGATACIRRARERIDADPAARLTLAELAREADLSRYQLIRAFARELGMTPHAYILQRRVELARRLIRARHSVSEAALLAGFCDQSHLTRRFGRQVGVTPRRYASRSA